MALPSRKYLPNDLCPEAPEDIRGPMHRSVPQARKDLRIAWVRERIREGFTEAAIASRLGINTSSVNDLVTRHALDVRKMVAGSYTAQLLGLSGGSYREAFNNAPPHVQAAVIDRALKDKTQILPAAFSLLAEALSK